MLMIDSLAYASRFRPVHPGKKVLAAVLLLIAVVTLQSITFGVILTVGMGALSVWGGGTPFRLYVRLLKIPMLFILLSLAAIVVNVTAGPAASGQGALDGSLIAVRLGPVVLSVFSEGIFRGAKLAVSALGAVSCMYFLALSTPLTDIFFVLEKIKCPFLIIELMLLIYRFVFLLWSIAGELNQAADSRLGNITFFKSVRTTGQMFATLFIRALRRSSALYDAMESRGYNGKIHVLPGFRAKNTKKL